MFNDATTTMHMLREINLLKSVYEPTTVRLKKTNFLKNSEGNINMALNAM
jgi:hypothetical protein